MFSLPKWCGVVILLTLLASACQDQKSRAPAKQTVIAHFLEQQLTDSLRKYWHLNEFTQQNDSPNYVLHGTTTTFGKVGVVAITDSTLLLFQEVKHRLQLTNRITFDNYATGFNEIDLNGDNKGDFVIYGHHNIHGQAPSFVFMNDGKGVLRYNNAPPLRSFGLDYDPNKKLVQTEYVGGAYDMHSKELYQWQGDSLRQVAGAELHLEHPDTVTVRVYRVRSGKEYGVRIYAGGAIYDTVLFKSSGF